MNRAGAALTGACGTEASVGSAAAWSAMDGAAAAVAETLLD
jgi:hypothetical protein